MPSRAEREVVAPDNDLAPQPNTLSSRLLVPALAILASGIVLAKARHFHGVTGGYPLVLAGIVAALAVYCGVREILASPSSQDADIDSDDSGPLNLWRAGLLLVAIAVDIALIDYIGFIAASAVFMAVGAVILGARSPIRIVAYAVIPPFVGYLVFERVLLLTLPTGPWGW